MLMPPSMPYSVAPSANGEALSHLGVAGYRSLQQLMLPLGPLTLVCGANGCGKSNLYRALGLVAAAARGDLVATLAAEGGLPAVLWAGPERGSQGAKLRLGFAGETLSYAIELGYGVEDQTSAFLLDPEIKREWIWAGGPFHPRSLLVQRNGAVVERCGNSQTPLALEVSPHESLFTAVSDPLEAPEVFQLRRTILSWRFYDSFRTDRLAPARLSRLATRTPSLAADGGDLAAAVQTIFEIGDGEGLQAAIGDAFPGVTWRWTPASRAFAYSCTNQVCCARSMQRNSQMARSTTSCWQQLCSARGCRRCWCSTSRKTASIPISCSPWRA